MRCTHCGIEAPTRRVTFYQNIGLLVMRFSNSADGYFCKSCIHSVFWQFTLVSLIFGWWGIISFFVNIFFIINNVVQYISSLGMPAVEDAHYGSGSQWNDMPGREQAGTHFADDQPTAAGSDWVPADQEMVREPPETFDFEPAGRNDSFGGVRDDSFAQPPQFPGDSLATHRRRSGSSVWPIVIGVIALSPFLLCCVCSGVALLISDPPEEHVPEYLAIVDEASLPPDLAEPTFLEPDVILIDRSRQQIHAWQDDLPVELDPVFDSSVHTIIWVDETFEQAAGEAEDADDDLLLEDPDHETLVQVMTFTLIDRENPQNVSQFSLRGTLSQQNENETRLYVDQDELVWRLLELID